MKVNTIGALRNYLWILLTISLACQKKQGPPGPYGAIPSESQLKWHEMEYYAFVHFNMNTFTDIEWGTGGESPAIFNPTELDCRQWARVCKEAGLKGIIITAKHHDGFCLWPSAYTEHSIKNSPYKDGKGDIIRELAEACKEYGLKMGIYVSPWDRNHADYGKPEYLTYFRNQLREVLTNYGDIFEVWFDGAFGGTGYYGGANEERKVDREKYYDWPNTIKIVRELQPNAVIFSDGGPDVRWVGNEQGFANPTNWSTLNKADYFPGTPRYKELTSGNKNGTHWIPAEVDVSIRPGWYYHPSQDTEVKSAEHLELIYYNSVGRNAGFLLNLPVDRRGLVHEQDAKMLMALKDRIEQTFRTNFALNQAASASEYRGEAEAYSPENMLDGNNDTYWATSDETTVASAIIRMKEPREINIIELKEYISLGQRVTDFGIDARINDGWVEIASGTTIGYRRLLKTKPTRSDKFRLRIDSALASPLITHFGLYNAPHQNYLLESKQELNERMEWWKDARFGMFIHWGAYAVPAGIYQGREISGIGEWIMSTAKIPIPEYEKFVRAFNPVKFDARQWAKTAKAAGMKYMIITSKHHDGFGLWDSEVSNYDIIDATDYSNDPLKELSSACKTEGIKLGFYYSIMDWHHPDANVKSWADYRDNYMKVQLKELIEKYDPEVLWFDGEWVPEWTEAQGKDLYQYVRSLKPSILINNRVGKGRDGMQGMNKGENFVGDFGTPEQEILQTGGLGINWESCMTMNDTWGYKKNDHNWKTTETLIRNLVDIVSKGGNYLLNVGPDELGRIPKESITRLTDMGQWLEVNGEAVYGTTPFVEYDDGPPIRYSRGTDRIVYAMSLMWPGDRLELRKVKPDKGSPIYLLGHEQPLAWQWDDKEGLSIELSGLKEASFSPGAVFTFKIIGEAAFVATAPVALVNNNPIDQVSIFSNQVVVQLQTSEPEAAIHFTTDGSTPTRESKNYEAPLKLVNSTSIKAITLAEEKVKSPVATFHFNKTAYNGVKLANSFSSKYSGGGAFALIDKVRGTTRFTDGRWQGFEEKDLEAVIDLGESKEINQVEIGFLQDLGAWIFPPVSVEISLATGENNYQTVSATDFVLVKSETAPKIINFQTEFEVASGRFVKIIARNTGICPAWHDGAGGKAWLFVDEIVVK